MKIVALISLIVSAALLPVSFAKESAGTKQHGKMKMRQSSVVAKAKNRDSKKLVLTLAVRSQIEGGKQKFTATAESHSQSATGPMEEVEVLNVHITEPADVTKDGRRVSRTIANGSVDAGANKRKAVTATALMSTQGYEDTDLKVTLPED